MHSQKILRISILTQPGYVETRARASPSPRLYIMGRNGESHEHLPRGEYVAPQLSQLKELDACQISQYLGIPLGHAMRMSANFKTK